MTTLATVVFRLRRRWQVFATSVALCTTFAVLAQEPPLNSPVVLDRVVAVVNNHAILASDLENERRLSVLEPTNGEEGSETRKEALERLIGRTLIRQQIRDEDEQSLVPTQKEIAERVEQMRRQLPVCVHANCATNDGWTAFLQAHSLTEREVHAYIRNRMETLRFIEVRFRQGVRISQEEIENYYRKTLLPQYPTGQPVPPLSQVSARIEEILLQEHVNSLFSEWLDNLQSQGDIEVLDPSLDTLTVSPPPPGSNRGIR